jgi:hypothetical protein
MKTEWPEYDEVVAAAKQYLDTIPNEISTNSLAAQLVGWVTPPLTVIYKALKACAPYELAGYNHRSDVVRKRYGSEYRTRLWHKSRGPSVERAKYKQLICPNCGHSIDMPSRKPAA